MSEDTEWAERGEQESKGTRPDKMFTLKKWNAVAMWSWDVECDTCAICRVQIMGKLSFLLHFTEFYSQNSTGQVLNIHVYSIICIHIKTVFVISNYKNCIFYVTMNQKLKKKTRLEYSVFEEECNTKYFNMIILFQKMSKDKNKFHSSS